MVSFDEAYGWLNKFSDLPSHLSPSVTSLVEYMNNALNAGERPKVHYYIGVTRQVGESLSSTLDHFDRAETHLACARAYYYLGDYRSAITEFRQALSYYAGKDQFIQHNRAVTLWMLGWAFWNISNQVDAIIQWETSCQIFQRISTAPDVESIRQNIGWYKDNYAKMCENLCQFIASVDKGTWPIE